MQKSIQPLRDLFTANPPEKVVLRVLNCTSGLAARASRLIWAAISGPVQDAASILQGLLKDQ
jgi:hypothetical protein